VSKREGCAFFWPAYRSSPVSNFRDFAAIEMQPQVQHSLSWLIADFVTLLLGFFKSTSIIEDRSKQLF
jgi:hypothetical protein